MKSCWKEIGCGLLWVSSAKRGHRFDLVGMGFNRLAGKSGVARPSSLQGNSPVVCACPIL